MLTTVLGRGLRAICAAFILCAAQSASHAQPAAIPEVDLKLFEKSEVDRSKGCTVALWQSNRDPDRDKCGYVFIETMTGQNNLRQPARIKIGGQAVTLQRVATGGKNNGYNLFEYQLYKMPGDNEYVVLELKIGALEGEAIEVESGTMTIVSRGKQVFRASVKGNAACMTPAAPPPAGNRAQAPAPPTNTDLTANLEGVLHRYNVRPTDVPRAFVQAVQKKYNCDAEFMKTASTSFQLSEESAIWQVPCERFAYQTTAVYALVHILEPASTPQFLSFQVPKGHPRTNEPGVLMSPEWDVKARTVKSVSLGNSSGTCGVLERHHVTIEGQFELLEYREKQQCDGPPVNPEQFPLVFRAK